MCQCPATGHQLVSRNGLTPGDGRAEVKTVGRWTVGLDVDESLVVADAKTSPGQAASWMRVVAPASEDDMVAAFLRAEVGSPRFGPQVLAALAHQGLDPSVLQQPDTSDAVANAARRRVLAAYRGYPDREVFFGLPADTVWQWVTLTRRELLSVRYIDWDYWRPGAGPKGSTAVDNAGGVNVG